MDRTTIGPDGVRRTIEGPRPPAGRMTIPANWRTAGLEGFQGRVRFTRRFQQPRRLAPEERLGIFLGGVDYFTTVRINDQPLGQHEGYCDPFGFDLTPYLAPRNCLELDVEAPAEAQPDARRCLRGYPGVLAQASGAGGGGIWNDVVLEVRSTLAVRDAWCRVESDPGPPRLVVGGRLVGGVAAPIHLDLSLGQDTVAEQPIEGSEAGTPFTVAVDLGAVHRWTPWEDGPEPTAEPQDLVLTVRGRGRALDQLRWPFRGIRHDRLDPHRQTVECAGRVRPLRAGAWVPAPAWSDLSVAGLHESVRGWRAAGVNCVRVLGHITHPLVYDAMDACGLLVWQDMPLYGGFSSDPLARAEALRQCVAAVRGLMHHPCIALWCAHVEPAGHDAALDAELAAAIGAVDPTRPCLASARGASPEIRSPGLRPCP